MILVHMFRRSNSAILSIWTERRGGEHMYMYRPLGECESRRPLHADAEKAWAEKAWAEHMSKRGVAFAEWKGF